MRTCLNVKQGSRQSGKILPPVPLSLSLSLLSFLARKSDKPCAVIIYIPRVRSCCQPILLDYHRRGIRFSPRGREIKKVGNGSRRASRAIRYAIIHRASGFLKTRTKEVCRYTWPREYEDGRRKEPYVRRLEVGGAGNYVAGDWPRRDKRGERKKGRTACAHTVGKLRFFRGLAGSSLTRARREYKFMW